MNLFISLKVKLIIFTLFFIISSTIAMGLITDKYIYDYSYENIKKQLKETIYTISKELKNTENSLVKSTKIISQNESLIASMSLIKNYENTSSYDSTIFDIEKKKILDILVSEGKYNEEDKTAIYDTKNNLVVFIDRAASTPTKGFVSYVDNQKVYYVNNIDSNEAYKLLPIPNHYHNEFNKSSENYPNEFKITYNNENNILNIKSNNNLIRNYSNLKDESVGYIESSSNIYVKNLNEHIIKKTMEADYYFSNSKKFTSEVNKYENIPLLYSKNNLDGTCLEKDEKLFSTAVQLPIDGGSILITVKMDKVELETSLANNRKKLLSITATIVFFTITLSLFVLHRLINNPVKKIIRGIDIISKGDYTSKIVIEQNDEFRLISRKFNEMAEQISKREFDLDVMAHQDGLTKIPNRSMFNNRLDKAIHRAARLNTKIAVFFIDLDDFKVINDTLGHDYGDELLIKVSSNLISVMRSNDLIARIGGDEFNVLVEDLESTVVAEEIAQKLLHQAMLPIVVNNIEVNVSASIGISIYPVDAYDTTTILKNADLAMYHAKDSGKNSYRFFSNELSAALKRRAKILTQLKNALKYDEFELYYQPKFSLVDGTIHSAEALIRWNNKELGFMSPDSFIPLAEESSEIVHIGRWVMQKACEDFMSWKKMGLNIKQISINVSNIQFDKDDIVDTLKKSISSTGIKASSIEIEITESYVSENNNNSIEVLHQLRRLGVGLAMDDFGTGFSSMSYLKKLPLTRLKIDKSFIDDIPHDLDDVEITKIIVALAKVMNLAITAEGVETIEQVRFLQGLDCDEGQGYICSKPVPNKEFINILKNGASCTYV